MTIATAAAMDGLDAPLKRAAIYCRISKDPTGQKAGVTRQEGDGRALAGRLGASVLEVFVDNDLSATSGDPRPEFDRLMAMVAAHEIDLVIVWHPDRLYRQPPELEQIMPVFEVTKVDIATCVAGDMDLSTPNGRMVARLVGAVARAEVETKTLRVEAARLAMRTDGRPPLTRYRLFGYDRTGMIVNEVEAAAINDAAQALIRGQSVLSVVRLLDELGTTTTSGNAWRPNTLRNLFANPRLKGRMAYKGQEVGDSKAPAILSPEMWESVNAALRVNKRSSAPRVSILNGLVFCGLCGHVLHTHSRSDRNYANARTYRCPTVPPYAGCGRVSILAERLEEMAEEYAKVRLRDPRIQAAINSRASSADKRVAALISELDEDRAQLEDLNSALGRRGSRVTQIMNAIDEVETRMELTRQKLGEARTTAFDVLDGWPSTVEGRSMSVRKALQKLVLKPSETRGGAFDPSRVEFWPVQY